MTEESGIQCRLFKIQEPHIKKATQLINQARDPKQKAREAEKMLVEINILLECAEYDDKKVDCQACRKIAGLRKQTAELIIKASKLA